MRRRLVPAFLLLGLFSLPAGAQLTREGAAPSKPQAIQPAVVRTPEQRTMDYADGLFEREMWKDSASQYRDFLAQYPDSASREAAMRRLAVSLAEMDRTDEALAAFRQYVEAFPKAERAPEARIQIGIMQLRAGQPAAAIQAFLEVVDHAGLPASQRELALYYLGQAYFQQRKFTEAATRLADFTAKYPKSIHAPLARFYLAESLRQDKKPEEALAHYREIIKRQSGEAGNTDLLRKSYYSLANAYFDLGKYAEAAEAFREIARKYPDWEFAEEAAFQVIWAASAQRNDEAVITAAREFLKKYQRSPRAFAALSLLAGAQFDADHFEDAATTYGEIVLNATDPQRIVLARNRLLWCDYRLERFDRVVEGARTLIEEYPDMPEAASVRVLLGRALYSQGKFDEAVLQYRQVVEESPKSTFAADAAYNLAFAYYQQKDYRNAAVAFEDFAGKFANSDRAPNALWLAGESYRQTGDYAAAADRLETLLQRHPNFPRKEDVLYGLFACQRSLARGEAMRETAGKLLATEPAPERAVELHYWLADQYYREKKFEEAAGELQKVLDLGKTVYHDPSKLLLGQIWAQSGKEDEAAKAFAELLLSTPPTKLPLEWHTWAARRYYELGKDWKATRQLWQRLLARPEAGAYRPEARLRAAQAALRSGQAETARKELLEFIKDYRDTVEVAEAELELGRVYSAEKAWQTAIEHYDKARARTENATDDVLVFQAIEAVIGKAEALLELGENEEARKELLYVILLYDFSQTDSWPRALYQLGQAQARLGEMDKARQRWHETIESATGSRWAEKAREALIPPPTPTPTPASRK